MPLCSTNKKGFCWLFQMQIESTARKHRQAEIERQTDRWVDMLIPVLLIACRSSASIDASNHDCNSNCTNTSRGLTSNYHQPNVCVAVILLLLLMYRPISDFQLSVCFFFSEFFLLYDVAGWQQELFLWCYSASISPAVLSRCDHSFHMYLAVNDT